MKFFIVKFFILWCVLAGLFFLFFQESFIHAFPLLFNPSKVLTMGLIKSWGIGLLGLLVGLIIEWYFVGYEKSALKKMVKPSPSTKRDIITCFFYIFNIWYLIGYVTFLGLPYVFGPNLSSHFQWPFLAAIPTDFGKAIATLFVLSFFEYWGHRLAHRWYPMWELHKYHHASTEMSVFAAHRNNPFFGVILSIMTTIPFSFFGATLGSYAWIGGLRMIHDYLVHSEIRHNWGFIGRWIIVSPLAHRVHHSDQKKHFDSNFGFFIIFWDRVFGTYVEDSTVKSFGVDDTVYNKRNLIYEMLYSLYKFFKPSPIISDKPQKKDPVKLVS